MEGEIVQLFFKSVPSRSIVISLGFIRRFSFRLLNIIKLKVFYIKCDKKAIRRVCVIKDIHNKSKNYLIIFSVFNII